MYLVRAMLILTPNTMPHSDWRQHASPFRGQDVYVDSNGLGVVINQTPRDELDPLEPNEILDLFPKGMSTTVAAVRAVACGRLTRLLRACHGNRSLWGSPSITVICSP